MLGWYVQARGVITWCVTATLIDHADLQDIDSIVQRYRHPGRADVADHVGDRLLQDSVGSTAHRARQWRRWRRCLEFDVESGVARLRGEFVDLLKARVRHSPVVGI